jgi:hypothetical protein
MPGLLLVSLFFIGCDHGVRPVEELVDIPRISTEELRDILGDPGTTVIDVRYTPNWKKSDQKILYAVREDPMDLGTWVDRYPRDHRLILYCD